MIPIRHSPSLTQNKNLRSVPARRAETNRQWLTRAQARRGVILLGGCSVAHFRVRVAQSELRQDLSPSLWSLVGLLRDAKSFVSVPLDWHTEASIVAATNGIQVCRLVDYDDPILFPNIAVIRFADDSDPLLKQAERLKSQRTILDLPSLMLAWLGFVWGAGRNPLLDAKSLPSAAFVDTVSGMAGIELTPGLSTASSCPEAIWQSARWWQDFYKEVAALRAEGHQRKAEEQHARPIVPEGSYALRQPAAAALRGDREATES